MARIFGEQLVGNRGAIGAARYHIGKGPASINPKLPTAHQCSLNKTPKPSSRSSMPAKRKQCHNMACLDDTQGLSSLTITKPEV